MRYVLSSMWRGRRKSSGAGQKGKFFFFLKGQPGPSAKRACWREHEMGLLLITLAKTHRWSLWAKGTHGYNELMDFQKIAEQPAENVAVRLKAIGPAG
jgi:hypothetical protein